MPECRHWDVEREECKVALFINAGIGSTELWCGCYVSIDEWPTIVAECWRRELADGEAFPYSIDAIRSFNTWLEGIEDA